jgi:hypothetical protein
VNKTGNVDEELRRYVEFCQRWLLTPGAEDLFDASLVPHLLTRRSHHLRALSGGQTAGAEAAEALLHLHETFRPDTRFELPETSAVFAPLLADIKSTAEQTGIRPIRHVRIATSTDVSATPYARPSADGEHLLFIGLGTSSFCNYWAKAFTALLRVLSAHNPNARCDGRATLESVVRKDPRPLLLMQRLAFHYAEHGTLIGFGEVEQPPDDLGYRLQLLRAMELFVVAHEFSHFVVEERFPEWRGSLEAQQVHASELFCDQLGFALSRQANSASESFDAFTGAGALVFLRAMELSLDVRERVTGAPCSSGHHPEFRTRVELLKELLRTRTAADQRERAVAFLEEYDTIAIGIRDILLSLMDQAQPPGADLKPQN